jgi:lysophospholipase L1-like esterase
MNPVTLHFASGASLFSGASLLLLAAALSPWLRSRWARGTRSVAGCLAIALVLGSVPPWPAWFITAHVAACAIWLFAEESARVRSLTGIRVPRVAIIGLTILLGSVEFPYTLPPSIPPGQAQRLYVIGDSISAGMGDDDRAWPTVLGMAAGIPVTNLAMDGATVADGLSQALRVAETRAVVLVEIGGNDLLSGLPVREFTARLEALLASLRRPGRTIVMVELPCMPFSIGYGRAQRALANAYEIHLIPKRFFTRVLGAPGATTDGLHLSVAGARLMADTILSILRSAFGGGTHSAILGVARVDGRGARSA